MELQRQNCIVCTKVVESNPVNVNIYILKLFQFLLETIDTSAVQNGLTCTTCIEKIQEAVNFKTSHLLKRKRINAEIQQETACNEKYVTCYICKNTTEQDSLTSLFNTYANVISYMIPKEDSDKLVDPQICDGCQKSALNFQSMIQFLSVYDLNKTNTEQLDGEMITDENEFKIDIVDSNLPEVIKEEVEESNEDFQQKQKLLYYDAGPSSAGSLTVEDKETSILQCPGNLTADSNVSNWTASIIKTEIDDKESIILNNENNYDSLNDNFNQMEMYKCSKCEFQTKYTNDEMIYKNSDDIDSIQDQIENNSYLQKLAFHDNKEKMCIHKNTKKIEIFKCQICPFQTKHKGNLKQHMLIHKTTNEVETFKCQNCHFQTKHKRYLKYHMLIHKHSNEVELFKCLNCEYQTKRKQDLKQHMHIHKGDNEVELFKCQNCLFQTKHKTYLKQHMLIHKDDNAVEMFKCTVCQFQTKYKRSLKQHELSHKNTNEVEMFKCQICQFQTKLKQCLKQHMRIHKDSNEIVIFKCHNCKYQAKQKGNLKQHMLIHTNTNAVEMFKCQYCQFQTKHKKYLKQHMLNHTNTNEVGTFKCQNCQYQTKHKRYLKQHMLIHKDANSVEIFKCQICQFQTKYKRSLRQHMLNHNNNNSLY